jgi:hypothetical protein
MGGMIVQEMTKIAGNEILKLICYGTGPRENQEEIYLDDLKLLTNLEKG